jgi:hypothetical protein
MRLARQISPKAQIAPAQPLKVKRVRVEGMGAGRRDLFAARHLPAGHNG